MEEVRSTELVASAQMKMWLPMLERVCWSTWFKRKGDGSCACVAAGKESDETSVYWVRWSGDDNGDDSEDEEKERDVEVKRTPF